MVKMQISSFFGLAPLRFKSRTNGYAVTLSKGMCIYSYLLITILVIMAVVDLVFDINAEYTHMRTHMSKAVFHCQTLIIVIAAGAGVYSAPWRMREMLKLLGSVASVDKSISTQYNNSTVMERKLCGVLLAIIIFSSILMTDDICFHAMHKNKLDGLWDFVTNCNVVYILWFMAIILELQFAFTALAVRKRFQAVNDALALSAKHVSLPLEKLNELRPTNMFAIRVAPAETQQAANIVNLRMESLPRQDQTVIIRKSNRGEPHLTVPPCEAIHQLASLHGTLCEVIHRINNSYSVLLIIILISTLLCLIVTPYNLIMETVVYTHKVHFLVLQSMWCVSHLLGLFLIVEPCHLTATEDKKTRELVCSLMTHAPPTGELSSRLQLFSRQLMLRSATYSPLGICVLDRTLLLSVFGTVTTYLVILIQFQQNDDLKQIK